MEERPSPIKIPHWRQTIDQGAVTDEIANYPYSGSGTEDDPYVVEWIPNDPRNPFLYSGKKWFITGVVTAETLVVTLISSAYTGGSKQIGKEFNASPEVVVLGVSLFVLGFALGPLIWGPLSELFGRQIPFAGTFFALTAFNCGAGASPNIATLLVLRFLAGSFGSSPLTNSSGVIADIFPAAERGLAIGLWAAAPFLGPVFGPIIGGFLGAAAGWRWVEGLLAILSGVVWIVGCLSVPETYTPVLLRRRAERLSKMTGKVYRSKTDIGKEMKMSSAFGNVLLWPWQLLFLEPIVTLLSIYIAIVYGTLYLLFGAFPIVYQQQRGWSEGVGGLSFLGVIVGMLIAIGVNIYDTGRYKRLIIKYKGFAPPETRLPPGMLGSIMTPVGLFWFAWTTTRACIGSYQLRPAFHSASAWFSLCWGS